MVSVATPRGSSSAGGQPSLERCPTCEQPIPHDRVNEVAARIAAREQERAGREAERVRASIEETKAEWTKAKEAEINAMRQTAAAETDQVRRLALERESEIRLEATKAAAAANAAEVAAAKEARDEAERQLAASQSAQETVLAQRLQEQREAFELDAQKRVNAEQSKAFEDKQKLEGKVEELKRQVQQSRSNDLGEGAEVDLYEELRAAFEEDKIKRVKKGEPGADVLQTVVEGGVDCALIVYDSKNRNQWRNDFVTKLRDDSIAAHGDLAILTTRKFPEGVRGQLHVQDGVIISNAIRAISLVTILRRQLIQLSRLRLSTQQREDKMARLYSFVTSERCDQILEKIETTASHVLKLDEEEQAAHSRVWKKRGTLIRSIQRASGDLSVEFTHIVGDDEGGVAESL